MVKRFPLQIGYVQKRVEIVLFFWAGDPLKMNLKAQNPEEVRVRNRTRRLSY